jgi:hypothetical protein
LGNLPGVGLDLLRQTLVAFGQIGEQRDLGEARAQLIV